MLVIDVIRQIDQADLPTDSAITQWANAACLHNENAEAAITICDQQQSQQLNSNYRNKKKPTNVLSFSSEAEAINGVTHLGDIVICASIVETEAKQQGKTLQAHWAHLVVHGMLHLQGYNHVDDTDASIMEGLEIKILGQFNFENPYQITDIAH
jgi:probable rRNA maturation factor